MELLGPLRDVLIVGSGLGLLLRRAVVLLGQLLLIAVAGLDGGGRVAYGTLALRIFLLLKSIVGLLVGV